MSFYLARVNPLVFQPRNAGAVIPLLPVANCMVANLRNVPVLVVQIKVAPTCVSVIIVGSGLTATARISMLVTINDVGLIKVIGAGI
jgi:hypothetical protein